MTRKTFHQLLAEETPLLMPVAHDALSARLIELAGFRAYSVGGFALAGIRYGLPDVGLASFGELRDGVRDLMRGSDLPVLVDADDGYGDVKNVTRTVREYEELGAAGLFFEDQTNPKRCGHMAGKSVVDLDTASRKLEAALAARRSDDFFIVARTDARAVYGLDEAISRGRRFAEIGADAIFVEAPMSIDELRIIGDSLDVPLLANMAEGGRTPILPPNALAAMGYSMIGYPSTLLLRMITAVRRGLEEISTGTLTLPEDAVSFQELTSFFRLPEWAEVEDKFGSLNEKVV